MRGRFTWLAGLVVGIDVRQEDADPLARQVDRTHQERNAVEL